MRVHLQSPSILARKNESRCRPRVPCTTPWLVARQVLSFGATTAPSVMRQVRIHTDCTAAGDIVVFLSPAGMSVVVDMSMWFDVSDRRSLFTTRGQDTSTCRAGTGMLVEETVVVCRLEFPILSLDPYLGLLLLLLR